MDYASVIRPPVQRNNFQFPSVCDTDGETTCEPSLQGIFSQHREFLNSSWASQGQKTQDDIEEADYGTG